MPSTEGQRYQIYKGGADVAVKRALDLLKQANVEEWRQAELSGFGSESNVPVVRYKMINEGEASLCGTSSKGTLNLRVDIEWGAVDIDKAVESYWKLWNDHSSQLRVYGLQNQEYKQLFLDTLANDKGCCEVSAAYYRECTTKGKDWVFVSSKRGESLPLSTISCASTSDKHVDCYVFGRSTTEHITHEDAQR